MVSRSSLPVGSTCFSAGQAPDALLPSDSGTEANEGALKFARKYGKQVDPSGNKIEIVSFTDGFHGRSFGSLSATWQEKYQAPFAPLIPGFVQATYNDTDSINSLITDRTCGVILEPIQGEGGIMQASEEWLRAVRKRCDEVNAVLIFDEIQVCSRCYDGRRKLTKETVRTGSDGQSLVPFALSGRLPSGRHYNGETAREWHPGRSNHDEGQDRRCHQARRSWYHIRVSALTYGQVTRS